MITKTFEIRDDGTFIPVIAVKLQPGCERDRYLLARAGFGRTPEQQAEYITMFRIAGGTGQATSDPYEWSTPGRTMFRAHEYINEHFDRLESGEVIDVAFILGETAAPKKSEQETAYPGMI